MQILCLQKRMAQMAFSSKQILRLGFYFVLFISFFSTLLFKYYMCICVMWYYMCICVMYLISAWEKLMDKYSGGWISAGVQLQSAGIPSEAFKLFAFSSHFCKSLNILLNFRKEYFCHNSGFSTTLYACYENVKKVECLTIVYHTNYTWAC